MKRISKIVLLGLIITMVYSVAKWPGFEGASLTKGLCKNKGLSKSEEVKQMESEKAEGNGYKFKIYEELPDEIIETVRGISYQEDGPVALEELTYLQLSYWGFDNKTHTGELIVNKELAAEVIDIFNEIYQEKFPIEKMRLIDEYNGLDERSMADNNSSAFCQRLVTGSENRDSKHSYGTAIDINPVQNPYVRGDKVLPAQGLDYIDRKIVRKGMIIEGNAVYKAFKKRGWIWGGEWWSLKDYQHFERSVH